MKARYGQSESFRVQLNSKLSQKSNLKAELYYAIHNKWTGQWQVSVPENKRKMLNECH